MTKRRKKARKKQGYPVAILIGFEQKKAVIWQIFSKIVKPLETITISKQRGQLAVNELYNFFEAIIDELRPYIKDGLRSIILAKPKKNLYPEKLLKHVQKHHQWLTRETSSSALVIGIIDGSANDEQEVSELVQTDAFRKIVYETTAKEATNIIEALEERLILVTQGEVVLYSLQEIEKLTYGQWKYGKRQPEYVMLTNDFLEKHKQKQRLHRLLQILKNKKVKTKIVDAETAAGERISQFG
ncbi:MAG: hypothetical protein ACTSQB_05605, partial [Candidatus Heimdallarchaeota archaeon]